MGLAGPWGGERVRQAHVCTNLSEAWKFLDNCMYLHTCYTTTGTYGPVCMYPVLSGST